MSLFKCQKATGAGVEGMYGNVLTASSLGPRQSGDTIEERWNNLMDEWDCQSRADNGVYSSPGVNTKPKTGKIPV